MKFQIIYSITFLFFFSCNRNISHLSNVTNQHLEYYQYTNKGLLAILDGNYKKSSKYYRKAFKNNEGFPMDYYNALSVADSIRDKDLAYLSAKRLAKLGICKEFFEDFPILKSDQNLWNDIVITKNDSYKYRDDTLIEKINEMFVLDQKVREYYDESLPHEELIQKQEIRNKTDSLNFIDFRKIINNHGFPSINKLGIECSSSNKGFLPPQYDILFIHFALHKYDGVINLLNTSLNKFEISNLEYATYIDKMKGGAYFRLDGAVVQIGTNYYYVKLNKEQLKEVNKHRKEIGLLTYEENVRIIIDQLKNNHKKKYRYKCLIDIFPIEMFTKEKIDRNFILIQGL
jgi:hypothetical protein